MNRNVLITGGNKGIGLACTHLFAQNGFDVAVVARDFSHTPLSTLSNVTLYPYDLTDIAGIPSLIEKIGKIDILVNNAGVMYSMPYDTYPDEKRDSMLRLNLEAPIALITHISPYMRSQHYGRIVNIASIASHIGHPDVWYGITKAGLLNATKSFAKLLGEDGIVINAVAPGPVETDMLDVIPDARKEAIKNAVYTGRFATAEEVARAVYWLATDCPEYINGTCIDINNGAFPR